MEDEENKNKNWNSLCLRIEELNKRLKAQDTFLFEKTSFVDDLVSEHESKMAEIREEYAIILQECRDQTKGLGPSKDKDWGFSSAVSQFEESKKEVEKSMKTLREKIVPRHNLRQIQVML
jgi:protein subunit release factor A